MNDQPSTSTNIRDIMIAAIACVAICVVSTQFRGCASDEIARQNEQYHRWDVEKEERKQKTMTITNIVTTPAIPHDWMITTNKLIYTIYK